MALLYILIGAVLPRSINMGDIVRIVVNNAGGAPFTSEHKYEHVIQRMVAMVGTVCRNRDSASNIVLRFASVVGDMNSAKNRSTLLCILIISVIDACVKYDEEFPDRADIGKATALNLVEVWQFGEKTKMFSIADADESVRRALYEAVRRALYEAALLVANKSVLLTYTGFDKFG